MDRTTDEPDVVIEEYEEVVENLDELSDRVESEDAETESIQEPTSTKTRILTTDTGRPSLRSTNVRLAGRQEESKPVVVTIAREFWLAAVAPATVKWQQRRQQLIRALHKNGPYSIWNSPILKMSAARRPSVDEEAVDV